MVWKTRGVGRHGPAEVTVAQIRYRVAQIHPVECVERVESDLARQPLQNAEGLCQGEIRFRKSGTAIHVASQIAVGSRTRDGNTDAGKRPVR